MIMVHFYSCKNRKLTLTEACAFTNVRLNNHLNVGFSEVFRSKFDLESKYFDSKSS